MIKYSDNFERFWSAWPRKVAKANAGKAWEKMNCEEVADQIVQAVEKQVRHLWIGKERKFIPHPASWLNAGRWEDEVEYRDDSPIPERDSPITDPTIPHEALLGVARHYGVCTHRDGKLMTTEQLHKLVWAKKEQMSGRTETMHQDMIPEKEKHLLDDGRICPI